MTSPTRRDGSAPAILAIANQKGGVGKTTTAINLAAALALAGHATLVIDLDPQGNASTGLGSDRRARKLGSYAMLEDAQDFDALVKPTRIEGLSLVSADKELAGAEIELVGVAQREYRLKSTFARAATPLSRFSYVLIDCPPSLGLLTLNGLVAADGVLVPLQCEFFALEGVSALVQTVDRVRRAFNPNLRLEGIVLTMYDRRNNLSELVADDARSFFGVDVFDTIIPRNIRISEAPSHGQSVLSYDPRSAGARAYQALADEVVERRRARSA